MQVLQERALPAEPTTALPGSLTKIDVLAQRYAQQLQLWHPQDAVGRFGRNQRRYWAALVSQTESTIFGCRAAVLETIEAAGRPLTLDEVIEAVYSGGFRQWPWKSIVECCRHLDKKGRLCRFTTGRLATYGLPAWRAASIA